MPLYDALHATVNQQQYASSLLSSADTLTAVSKTLMGKRRRVKTDDVAVGDDEAAGKSRDATEGKRARYESQGCGSNKENI